MKFHLVRIGAAAFFGSIPNFANGIVYFEPFDCNQPIRLFQLIDEFPQLFICAFDSHSIRGFDVIPHILFSAGIEFDQLDIQVFHYIGDIIHKRHGRIFSQRILGGQSQVVLDKLGYLIQFPRQNLGGYQLFVHSVYLSIELPYPAGHLDISEIEIVIEAGAED